MTLTAFRRTPCQFSTLYDPYLIIAVSALLVLGLLMVTSASMGIAERNLGSPFYYLTRQVIFLIAGFILGLIVLRLPMTVWKKLAPALLIISIGLLICVLIPGIGRQVNGSMRWIRLGFFNIQASEFAKLGVLIYIADYLVRRQEEVRQKMSGFLKPMLILSGVAGLLLLEPDLGASVVIMGTALALMFLAGVRLWQFGALLTLVVGALVLVMLTSPYRLARLTTFLNPWATQFDSGYQLTQSLIAFGRGGWTGVGLGESVQKLFYLPEAHTDFLFAVLAEELGFIGVLCVIFLFVVLIGRAFLIGRRAEAQNNLFFAYLSYGIALWFSLQVIINMGVNSGMLPTKGLTLPLISYGGGSLLVSFIAIAMLIRIDYESRLVGRGFA